MINKFFLIISLFFSFTLYAQDASDYIKEQMAGFYQYKKKQIEEFEAYKKAQEKAFKEYKKELGVYWEKPKLSTKKEWVAYSKDKKTRTDVDFDKNKIIVETVAKSKEEAKRKLQVALAKVTTIDTKNAIEKDPLEQRLAKIKKPQNMVDAKVDKKPILSTVVYKKRPTPKSVRKFVYKHVNDKTIKKAKSKKIKGAYIYKVEVKLPKDTTYRRSKIYAQEVKQNANKQKLPKALVFAIMHTESSFNPKARSYVPAYGLMQIVPKTAGVDSYYYLYKVKKRPSSTYLYNSSNNIRLGSAYLHILYYSYLKKVRNPISRLYCAIAAYNTGAGNVAWAFTRSYNISKAARIINKLSPDEVYRRLLRDLKYDEPKNYLKRVTKRMNVYKKIYGM